MHLPSKISNILRGLLQVWGTTGMKRNLWNREFSQGRWKCLETTPNDFVYLYLEKYARNGSILDLGCGSGNTGNELNFSAFSRYVGVDVSDVALREAKKRTAQSHRTRKNSYYQSDICDYKPDRTFDVILFRESLFYVPLPKIEATLARYSKCLAENGVFMVRMCDKDSYRRIVETIERDFHVLEKHDAKDSNAVVIVFR